MYEGTEFSELVLGGALGRGGGVGEGFVGRKEVSYYLSADFLVCVCMYVCV
jgi:hypothetical protein